MKSSAWPARINLAVGHNMHEVVDERMVGTPTDGVNAVKIRAVMPALGRRWPVGTHPGKDKNKLECKGPKTGICPRAIVS